MGQINGILFERGLRKIDWECFNIRFLFNYYLIIVKYFSKKHLKYFKVR